MHRQLNAFKLNNFKRYIFIIVFRVNEIFPDVKIRKHVELSIIPQTKGTLKGK